MRITVIFIIVIFSLLLFLLPGQYVIADKEPNNAFQDTEIIDEGRVKGTVYIGFIEDKDYYSIKMPEKGNIIIKVFLKDTGNIFLQLYDGKNSKIDDMYAEVDPANKISTLLWEKENDVDEIVAVVIGTGEYELEIEYTYQDGPSNIITGRTISLIVIFILIGSLLLVITIIFFKEINLRDTSDKFDLLDDDDILEALPVDMNYNELPSMYLDCDDEISIPVYEGLKKSIFE